MELVSMRLAATNSSSFRLIRREGIMSWGVWNTRGNSKVPTVMVPSKPGMVASRENSIEMYLVAGRTVSRYAPCQLIVGSRPRFKRLK